LILQMDSVFVKCLEMACGSMANTVSVQTPEEALEAISLKNFDLLLLEWDFLSSEGSLNFKTLCQLQPESKKIALFQIPDLPSVVLAMKMGFDDILWAKIGPVSLNQKIKDALSNTQTQKIRHTHLSPLVDSLAQRSLDKKATLFQARREFYRLFLQKILINTSLPRHKLAALLEVSPRTLQRHLSLSGALKPSLRSKNP
jgi:PleD family two-component response regulator